MEEFKKTRHFALRDLDLLDSTVLKGLAITAILFHNFFHFVIPVEPNEFSFSPSRFHAFMGLAVHPGYTIQAFFAFFGQFGVQVFTFLSAFGLAKSHWDDPASWTTFMWGRIKKLYPAFGLVVIPWFIACCSANGTLTVIKQSGLELVAMALGVSTVLGFDLPPVGPWWFIPFIVQFYALWPALRKLTLRFGWRGLVVLAIVCRVITFVAYLRGTEYLILTPIGHMTGLCLGIAAARFNFRISAPVAVLAGSILLLGTKYILLWQFTYAAALVFLLWLYSLGREMLRRVPILQRLGECSLYIFLLNGIVRGLFVKQATTPASQLLWGAINAAVSFLIAAIFQYWLLRKDKQPDNLKSGGGVLATACGISPTQVS